MGGPIVGTALGLVKFDPAIGLGWLGLFLMPTHPLYPNTGTGWVTVVGLLLWLFAGFWTVMLGAWGG
jgi:hypothetical protein